MANRRTTVALTNAVKTVAGVVPDPLVMKNNIPIRAELPSGEWRDLMTMTSAGNYELGTGAAPAFLYSSADPVAQVGGNNYKFVTEKYIPSTILQTVNGLVAAPIIMKNAVPIRGELTPGGTARDILNMTAGGTMEVGTSQGPLALFSSADPVVTISGNNYKLYTERLPPPGNLVKTTVITANGNFTKTTGVKTLIVEAVGGGGGSLNVTGATGSIFVCSGGGSGGYIKVRIDATSISAAIAVTIGAGGAGAGGNTTFGNYFTAPGGVAGSTFSANTTTAFSPLQIAKAYVPPSLGTPPTTTTILAVSGSYLDTSYIAMNYAYAGAGGSNPLGLGGPPATALVSGVTASLGGAGFGSGAGGAIVHTAASASGARSGLPGVVIVYEYS